MPQQQVLQEFFVIVTRKVAKPLPVDEAADRVREFATWKVFAPTAADVLAAITLQKQSQVNFWDAMVVAAAAESRCEVLWTEDLTDGHLLRGVRIRESVRRRKEAIINRKSSNKDKGRVAEAAAFRLKHRCCLGSAFRDKTVAN